MNVNKRSDLQESGDSYLVDEQLELMMQFNNTKNDFPSDRTIIDMIEEQVLINGNQLAIIFNGVQMTYNEMNEKANQLANYLLSITNLDPDDRVGVMMDRSEKLIISLLAILKTGAAYVPMPPLYPDERLRNIAERSDLKVILSEKTFENSCQEISTVPIVYWEGINWEETPKTSIPRKLTPDHLMYIMFTSGSTGGPKGVAIEHRSVVNILHDCGKLMLPSGKSRMLFLTTFAFDISVLEMFLPLITGNTVIVASQQEQLNPESIIKLIIDQDITVVQATPTTWSMIIDAHNWADVKPLHILCGGEYLSPALGEKLLTGGHRLWNVYGPTETTIWSTLKEVKTVDDLLTIGKPIANTEVFILDGNELASVGNVGEICISGTGLARGYFGQQELTDLQFIKHPFQTGTKLYRTGDLGKWLPIGEIEYLGRKDDQVKIRGYRIELKEIEEALTKLTGVEKAVVKVRADNEYDKKLIAFLEYTVTDYEISALIKNFRQQLKQRLPSYMIPHDFILVDKIPVNSNGKIDRKALVENYTAADTTDNTQSDVFNNEYERTIAKAWGEVLQYPHIDINDDFFELGGHSLLLTKLYNRLPEDYKQQLSLNDLFLHRTIAAQAHIICLRYKEGKEDLLEAKSEIMTKLLLQDASLVPDITVNGTVTAATMNAPEYVLLTGANGFVGVHVLIELLEQTNATVYCLVRAENEEIATKRLHQAFEQFILPNHWLATGRIKAVTGDLNKPLLGFSEIQFEQLAETIDCIYHSGSSVNFIEPYSIIRKANILGLQEIIKFAATGKVKPISLFSTIAVFSWGHEFTEKKMMTEEDDLSQNLPAVSRDLGYVQSKWVMEQIVNLAAKKGVPVIVFRLGYALANSKTGATAVYQWWSTLLKNCIANKSYPWLMGHKPQLTTVDYIAKCIVHISRKKDAVGKNFHLTPLPEADVSLIDFFDRINQYFGYEMKPLSYDEWMSRWKNKENDPLYPLFGMFSDLIYEELTLKQAYQNTYYFSIDNTLEFMKDSDTPYPPLINKTILEPYLKFLGELA